MALAAGSLTVAGQPADASAGAGATAANHLSLSAALQQQLRRMYASYRHIPVSDVTLARPGLAREARAADGTTWALVAFSPSRKASMAVQAGFQDGADNGIFTRAPGKAWRIRGVGRAELACDGLSPVRIRRAWGLGRCLGSAAGHPRAGYPRASRPRARDATLAGLTSNIVSLANQYASIPVEDNPGAPANSFTFDCNPFSTLLNEPGTADSSCGTDATFSVQDSNQQWCSDFAIYVWKQAGALGPLDDLTPLSSSFYTYGHDQDESMPVDPPASAAQPGDAMILYPPGSTPGASGGLHVGIVTAVNSDGTLDVANGDFLSGSQGQIQVVSNNNMTPAGFANYAEAGSPGAGQIEWTFVAPELDPWPVPNLSTDALTTTWQNNSLVGSTGSPQPLPTTTADCGVWTAGDATQVVALGNGDNLWTFGDTELGPAVTRQDFFNNGSVRNSMVLQSGNNFTTITGANGCPTTTTGAKTPVTPPSSSPGDHDWPSSSITYNANLVKFYYSDTNLTQESPQVVELPQSEFESGNTITATSVQLDGCVATQPIMWGAATIRATTNGTSYTYIYGNQTATGDLFLARTSGDPGDQSTWTYYTGGGSFSAAPAGGSCGALPLAQLGNLQVSTEFSVTSVGGQFWLTQEDPGDGTFPEWAAVHSAAQPWSFSGAPGAGLPLFSLGMAFSGIDDSYPGFTAYAVRMLEPSAVTPSTSGDVVIAFNVNDTTELDAGCIPLIDYDANVYVPRFIDVPEVDFTTGSPLAILAGAAQARAGASGPAAGRAVSSADASSFTYHPDAVPNVTWQPTSCPTSDSSYYQPVDPNIKVTSNPDGSLDLAWPNQGPDVWYWVHWEDVSSASPIWTKNLYWSEGPNADGWQNLPAKGLTPSDTSTIRLHFVPPGGIESDKYSFWVQAFAAGAGGLTSNDSAATATTPKASIIAKPTNLTATEPSGAVKLSWTPVAELPGETVVYLIEYKLHGASAWTQLDAYVNGTSYTFPSSSLTAGQAYDFRIAAADTSGSGPWTDSVPFTPDSAQPLRALIGANI